MNDSLNKVLTAANRIILGRDKQNRLAVSRLLSKRHSPVEDLPGKGSE
ncbi:MAG: hypothetical protein ACU84H_09555 [Gammaproteobacteria bacterium]